MDMIRQDDLTVVRKGGDDAVVVDRCINRSVCDHDQIPFDVGIDFAELVGDDRNLRVKRTNKVGIGRGGIAVVPNL